MHNQEFDNLFKNKLEGYSKSPGANLWNNIQTEMTGKVVYQTLSLKGIVWSAVSVLSIATILVCTYHFENEKINQKDAPVITAVEKATKVTENQKPKNDNKEIKQIEVQTYNDGQLKQTTTRTNETVKNKASDSGEIKNEEKVESVITQIGHTPVSTTLAPNLSPKKESSVKEYFAGEYVTFRFDFENTTGKNLNSVEIWEEFPEWCDVSSIETISSDNFHTVKTKINERYNEVVWKIKGDFSGDLTSINNKGFIEYRLKLTESKKANELIKNQPQIK